VPTPPTVTYNEGIRTTAPATVTIQGSVDSRGNFPHNVQRDVGNNNDRNGYGYNGNSSGDWRTGEQNIGGQVSARAPHYVPPRPQTPPTPPQGPRYSGQGKQVLG
ncbi:hypothetical protein GIB67_036874, partial [Kingdonia uniflora]